MEGKWFFEHLIHQNGISMHSERVHSNPVLVNQETADEVEHYRYRLCRPGKEMDVYLSVHPDDGYLAPSDVLFLLALDASGCKMLEGFDSCRDEWTSVFAGSDGNLPEIESFWQEYKGRCSQSKEFRRFLGDSVYEELIQHFWSPDGASEPEC